MKPSRVFFVLVTWNGYSLDLKSIVLGLARGNSVHSGVALAREGAESTDKHAFVVALDVDLKEKVLPRGKTTKPRMRAYLKLVVHTSNYLGAVLHNLELLEISISLK